MSFLRRLFKKDEEYQEALVIYPVWAQDCANPLSFLADAKAYEEAIQRLLKSEYQLALHRKSIYVLASKLAAQYFDLTIALEHGDYKKLSQIVVRMGKDLKKIREVVGYVSGESSTS